MRIRVFVHTHTGVHATTFLKTMIALDDKEIIQQTEINQNLTSNIFLAKQIRGVVAPIRKSRHIPPHMKQTHHSALHHCRIEGRRIITVLAKTMFFCSTA